jgi:hypothetical protein
VQIEIDKFPLHNIKQQNTWNYDIKLLLLLPTSTSPCRGTCYHCRRCRHQHCHRHHYRRGSRWTPPRRWCHHHPAGTPLEQLDLQGGEDDGVIGGDLRLQLWLWLDVRKCDIEVIGVAVAIVQPRPLQGQWRDGVIVSSLSSKGRLFLVEAIARHERLQM